MNLSWVPACLRLKFSSLENFNLLISLKNAVFESEPPSASELNTSQPSILVKKNNKQTSKKSSYWGDSPVCCQTVDSHWSATNKWVAEMKAKRNWRMSLFNPHRHYKSLVTDKHSNCHGPGVSRFVLFNEPDIEHVYTHSIRLKVLYSD